MRKLKAKNVIFRILTLVVALVLVFVVPKINIGSEDDLKYIYGTFIGQKSPYNGIIEIWNIDTFESGLKSKSSYLDAMAKKFQKRNKGLYVVLRNLTIGECQNLLKSGEIPDVISCSYGVSDSIKDYVSAYEDVCENVFDNFLEAGRGADGKLYALAWCTGFYSLISTKSKLEKAGKITNDVNLNEIAFESSYEFKVGKKNKLSRSLVFGSGDYLMPKNALKAYNKARSIQIEETENKELNLKSQYSAYTSFLSNDATILLGTHRDVFKMQAREESGKIQDVVYLPLTNWTDLVQFSFLCKGDNNERNEMAEKFAIFLTETRNQEKLEDIGMFPVTKVENTSLKGVMRDIILENFSDYELEKVI